MKLALKAVLCFAGYYSGRHFAEGYTDPFAVGWVAGILVMAAIDLVDMMARALISGEGQ